MSMAASSGRRSRARPPRRPSKKISACNFFAQGATSCALRAIRRSGNRKPSLRRHTEMRHLKSGSKLGRNPWHRRATLRNLVTNLFEHGRITTTLTRAKAARPVAEKMITLGKRDTLQSRRQAASYIMTPAVTKKLFSDIAPKFADRAGGYTRIIPAGVRVGDGAKVAILELVGYEFKKKEKKEKTKKEEVAEAKS